MKACCPECGYIAGLMSFVNERDAHEFKDLALRWPAPLRDPLVRYLALFNPPKRLMGWGRGTKLMRELVTDIERGYITRRGRDWIAPHDAWHAALTTVINQRDTLTLPLRDHNYLYEIICRGANKTEAVTEAKREDTRRKRRDRARSTQSTSDVGAKSAPPPGGSLKAALAQARGATQSPTQYHTTED